MHNIPAVARYTGEFWQHRWQQNAKEEAASESYARYFSALDNRQMVFVRWC